MERRLKCGVCAAAALALVLCFSMEQKTRAMQTAGNAQTTLVIDAGHGGFDGGAVRRARYQFEHCKTGASAGEFLRCADCYDAAG